jgi:hypothetical protein
VIDRDALLKARLPERTLDIDGVGTIRVRALSRAEALEVRACGEDLAGMEQKILTFGLVDPALSPDDVANWYRAAPAGEIEPITNAIVAMSGLADDAAKEAYKSFRGQS